MKTFNGKLKAITFSFDDGITQDIRMIELLNKYNLKATFNINSGLLASGGIIVREGLRIAHYKVYPNQIKEIYEGHEVAAHTLTHPLLTKLSDEEVIKQVEEDRKVLSDMVGYEVVEMAYPGGGKNYDSRVAQVIKNNTNIKYARTTELTKSFDRQKNLFEFLPNMYFLQFDDMMKMGEEFVSLNPDKPQIYYIWGHSYEMDYGADYWVRLENFFKLIANRDDIFYGTNKEVLL